MTKTATEHRADAREARDRVEESFQRCDTDGFLSQWAGGLSAGKSEALAEIAENDGMADFPGLYDGDRRVRAKEIRGKFGLVWILSDEEAETYGRKFIPSGPRSRVQKALGLAEETERATATAIFNGQGTGLSGTCWVEVIRTDGGYGPA